MRENSKKVLSIGVLLVVGFVIWTGLIQWIDVQPVGVNGTNIGFATINVWVHSLTGVHMDLYVLTDWLGLVPVFVCMVFGGIGFVQMVQRRSVLKVDYDILILGIYYLLVIGCYLIFEMIPINYRPILIEGILEASYPSSTTLLVLCVMPTLVEQMNRRANNLAMKKIIAVLVSFFSAFMVIGRLISGVHWLTDIIASLMLSAGLFYIYKAIVISLDKKETLLEALSWNFTKNCRN